jgi:predicted branched-subunit amino acid permease
MPPDVRGCARFGPARTPASHRAWRGAVDIAPLAAFVVPFGVAASARGIPPDIGVFMSVAIYAGASQFAVLDLWQAPLPLATLALTVLAVNARLILLLYAVRA